MKIQYYGTNTFSAEGKDTRLIFAPEKDTEIKETDILFCPSGECPAHGGKKELTLPGEFEISGVLIKGFYSEGKTNTAFKADLDGIVLAHLGELKSAPEKEFYNKLGENVDVLFLCLNEKIGVKEAKDIIENIDPRYIIIGGDQSHFPAATKDLGAKTAEENVLKIARSDFSDEVSQVLILPI